MSIRPSQVGRASGRLISDPGFTLSITLPVSLGIGVGVPLIELVHASTTRSNPYTDSFLRGTEHLPDWLPHWTTHARTIPQLQDQSFQVLSWLVLGLALLLVAAALINTLNLALAQATTRRPEIAMRAVLGATPGRLSGGLATDAFFLLLPGAALGLLLGAVGVRLLGHSWPGEAAPWGDLSIGATTFAPVLGVLVLGPLLASLSLMRIGWSRDLRRFLTTGGRATADRGETSARNALAIVQIGGSLVILVSAGLLFRGFISAPEGHPGLGFDPRDTLVMQVHLPEGEYATGERRARVLQEMMERVRTLPGVVDASVTTTGTWIGLGATDQVTTVCPECSRGAVPEPMIRGSTRIHAVTPGFFSALGAPVLRGRELEPSDRAGAARVAVISDTFAHRLFPRGEPLGKEVQIGGRGGDWYRVVGIVDDVRARGFGASGEHVPAIYLSALQHPPGNFALAVRAIGEPTGYLPMVERAIRKAEPRSAVVDAMTMEEYLARYRAPLRWLGHLFGALAVGVLVLASSGLYSVMSHNTGRRTREIGIRMALGAEAPAIMRMVLGWSVRLTALGAVLGLIVTGGVARMLQLLFHGVEPLDPLLFGVVAITLGAVALAASYRPARRATAVDPLISLRE